MTQSRADERAIQWTRWLRWNEIARAALILGVVPDYSQTSMRRLSEDLHKRVADGSVKKQKAGPAQSDKAEYSARLTPLYPNENYDAGPDVVAPSLDDADDVDTFSDEHTWRA